MLTFVAVSLNALPGAEPLLPSTIANNLIPDLGRLALQDIFSGRFGVQRHLLPSYVMMYRLDVAPEVLRHAAEVQVGATEEQDYPSFNQILELAKVWVSFDEHADNVGITIETKENSLMARTLSRHIAVFHDQPTPKEANVPDSIERTWRTDLALIVLQDLLDYQFGARRHNILSRYNLIYRLDVSENVLLCCARHISGAPKEPGTPTVPELLSYAKVWLEFEDQSMTVQMGEPLTNIEEVSTLVSPALSNGSEITLVGESDMEYTTTIKKAKSTKCVRFDEEVAIIHYHESDVVSPNLKPLISLPTSLPGDGSYERVFGPMHPNGAPRRRRRPAPAARECPAPAPAESRPDVGVAIYEVTHAVYRFNPIILAVKALKTVASHAIGTAISSFSSFSQTESRFTEPLSHYGAEYAEYDMVASCY